MAIKMGTPKPKAQDKNLTISSASYSGTSFSISNEDGFPRGIFFNSGGTKMFMVGASSDSVHQYTLGTGFDLSTASYDSVSFDVSSQETIPLGIYFNNGGTQMFIVGSQTDSIYQYTLGTGFDLSTATYDSISFNVSGQETNPQGIFFNSAGTKMFIVGNASDSVHQYTLGTGFDLSSASYDSVSLDVSSQDGIATDIYFNSTGTRMFLIGNASDSVHQYTLGTGFDLSTASYDSISFDISGQDGTPQGIYFNATGTKMFMVGSQNESVNEYNL